MMSISVWLFSVLFFHLTIAGKLLPDAFARPYFDRYRYGNNAYEENGNGINELEEPIKPTPSSNLGCFLCTQLLAVTKHRVGLSQNQLKSALYDKCYMLPNSFREQCVRFVDGSLPEIYFSLNYDLSTQHVCVTLNLCDEKNPFAKEDLVVIPPPPQPPPMPAPLISQPPPIRPVIPPEPRPIVESVIEPPMPNIIEPYDKIGVKPMKKGDITAFAQSACSKLPKGRFSEQCYELADRKISELSVFVDQQVVEALWCAELNQC